LTGDLAETLHFRHFEKPAHEAALNLRRRIRLGEEVRSEVGRRIRLGEEVRPEEGRRNPARGRVALRD
jgi:hypothetical protein